MEIYTILISDHITATIATHSHNYYQFIYCQSGRGTIVIGDTPYSAIPGKGYLVKPMVSHSITPSGNMRLTEFKFTVSDEDFVKSLTQIPEEFEIDEHLSLRMSLKDVLKEGLSQKLYSNEATNAAMLIFLIKLLRKSDVKGEDTVSHRRYFDPPFKQKGDADNVAELVKVIDYIEEHLEDPLTLEILSEVAHFEKSYLNLRFNEIWGISPMKYVNLQRIERAKVLLATTNKSITNIAKEVGFGSIHYFSRYFKEKEDLSPNDYRIQKSEQEKKGNV